MSGNYYPAMRIVKEEGGGESGIEAAANYVAEAVRRFKLNETLSSKPYVLFNAWTKRHEFLYVKESTSEQHRREITEQRQENAMVQSLEPSASSFSCGCCASGPENQRQKAGGE